MFDAAPGGGAWAPGCSQGTLTLRVAANRIDRALEPAGAREQSVETRSVSFEAALFSWESPREGVSCGQCGAEQSFEPGDECGCFQAIREVFQLGAADPRLPAEFQSRFAIPDMTFI